MLEKTQVKKTINRGNKKRNPPVSKMDHSYNESYSNSLGKTPTSVEFNYDATSPIDKYTILVLHTKKTIALLTDIVIF